MLPQKSGVGINSQSRDSTRSGETRMICWSIAIAPSCQSGSQTSTAQARMVPSASHENSAAVVEGSSGRAPPTDLGFCSKRTERYLERIPSSPTLDKDNIALRQGLLGHFAATISYWPTSCAASSTLG